MKAKSTFPKNSIVEVFADNFISEIKRMSQYLESYPYIGMDTEFPGTVYPCLKYTPEFYYEFIKTNVDQLKLIQLGVTLCNEKGENPPDGGTWQFNLDFNINTDAHSSESIELLTSSGIDFNRLMQKGIDHVTFAEYFMVSGLILNSNLKWVSFNGFTDFAYLLRLVLGSDLPEKESDFINTLTLYFPQYYDIKILLLGSDKLKGGLNRLAQQLNVERIGENHQAGSDSIVTIDVFFALLHYQYITSDLLLKQKNVLFGIGVGADNNETIQYTQFASASCQLPKKSFPQQQPLQLQQHPSYYPYENINNGNAYYNQFNAYPQYNNGTAFDQGQKSKSSYSLLMAYDY